MPAPLLAEPASAFLKTSGTPPAAPAVSIVIPTFNRAAVLQATVAQFRLQNFDDFELWVIDQSDAPDRDANIAYIRAIGDPRLNYLHLTTRGPSNARNEGLARTRAEIVLFVDDDVLLLSRDFIGAHVRAYDAPDTGGVTGRHVERLLRINARRTACHVAWSGRTIFNLFGHEHVTVGSVKGSNMSFRMAAVRQAGAFDRRLKFLEETDFSTRIRNAGWRIVFEPAAEIVHLSAPSGGVRERDRLQSDITRFECTAYYILKHRGWIGAVPFVLTFALIGSVRMLKTQSLKTGLALAAAIARGFSAARLEPDQALGAVAAVSAD
jgi:GT2 family glycosyltransferase